uniref:Pentacotripeptide-repeat region of PRORP domain-containing protein n=2 Tax=Kalmanozyma brasiliensis (strain GHG001) TaxID=1365824 RepID=V5EMD1_KALBG
MTRGEERKARTATDLKQRLKDARDKGRVLLPPSTAAASRGEQVAIEETIQEETGVVVDEAEMAALPYAERQEIRLQQLFARLALVHTTSDAWASSSETGTDSLQEIKSNLANRIAKILKEHDYELQTSVQQGTPNEASPAELTSNDAAALGPFPTARLDGRAPTLEPTESIDTKQAEDISSTDSSDELITRAETMVNDLSSSESRSFMLDSISKLVRSSSPSSPSSSRIPLGVASIEEWTALAVASARANDTSTLSRTLGLMQDCGYPPSLSLYNNVLDAFATQGQLEACQTWLEQMHTLGLVPDDHTYHSLVKAYATSSQYLPAITLLNTLEEAGRPASMATYTLLISRLLSTPTPSTQAVGWNAFYHMRLSAHPIPDAPLYALMIRACARGVPQPHDLGRLGVSEAERALDLFREMTTRYSVRPNAEVYNALILACARRKDFYLEAFRLLREMVELETTRSEGEGLRFAPDRWTFNVLLQGCARNRDLPRARWVLAEMVRCTAPLFEQGVREKLGREEVREMWGKRPDEESLCHVFHAYASYVPPVRRLVTVGSGSPETTEGTDSTATTGDNDPSTSSSTTPSSEIVATATAKSLELILSDPADAEEETTPGEAAQIFSALVPQTSSDLLAETRSLFARVLADQPSGHTEGPLGAVTAGVRLVNAYLAVLGAHLPVGMRGELLRSTLLPLDGQSEGLERGLFARLGATPNEHSYRVILEALREADGSTLPIVEDVWVRFQTYLGSHTAATGDTELTTTLAQDPDAGQITKCYSAYIHFHAKHASLDQAIGALRHFVSLYPPTLPTTRTASARRHARQRKDRATDAMLEGVDVDLSPLPVAKESLVGLVEMASPSTSASSGIGEDQTEKVGAMKPSPTLTFLDVELLHHRLVRFGRIKDVGFVSWVLHRYAAARRG